MKYKKLLSNLKKAQEWDKQDQRYKDSTTRSGGIHQRVIVGKN